MSLSGLVRPPPAGPDSRELHHRRRRDGLWIIDQHVAHERILFEQVLKQRAAGRVEMQRLLMPLILQLTPEQQIDYARIADELHASGFETEPFGNRTIAVKAARRRWAPQTWNGSCSRFWRSPKANCAEPRWTTYAATSAPRSPAAPLSKSTCGSTQKDGVAAARARRHRLPDELPARPAHRAALLRRAKS